MNFISKVDAKRVLEKALATGGTFAEIFFEHTINNSIEMLITGVSKTVTNIIHGASIRILDGTNEVFGYVNDWSVDSLLNLAEKLAAGINNSNKTKVLDFVEQEERNIINPIIKPATVSNDKKIEILSRISNSIKNYSEEIVQAIASISDKEQHILVCNSKGVFIEDLRSNNRAFGIAVASYNGTMQSINDSIGDNCGYEFYENYDLESFGKEIAASAVKMAHADEMTGGKMTVVVHNAFGGVLLHEACVHSLEATSVAKGASVFCNKLGQKIASDIVTAIDDGSRPNQWGSLNYDDEGHPTQKNVLIENGILKSYLVDYRNSLKMNHPVTGSGRRQSFTYSPTSRMTNTFFAPGKDKFEDIIKDTEYGLFAKRMGGGSVNPSTGEFNFTVSEGYLIENGKITKPVRGATLVGSGSEVLMNIDRISDNLAFGHGMCGSASGSVPTDVGQPTIRVQNITVGGRGSK